MLFNFQGCWLLSNYAWCFSISYFFPRFSEVSFSRLFMLFKGLYLVVSIWLLHFILFILLWACKFAVWCYCFCLVTCAILRLTPSSFCLIIVFYGFYIIMSLHSYWFVFIFFSVTFKLIVCVTPLYLACRAWITINTTI